jgi:hypothetical protein
MGGVQDLAGANSLSGPGPKSPAKVPVVPGQLSARIFLHDVATALGEIPCWSFVTEGLAPYRQPELVVTLRRRPSEGVADYPRAVLDLFGVVYQRARDGRVATAGAVAEFPLDVLGHGAPTGVVFVPAQPLPGVGRLQNALAGLLLRPEELRAAQQVGPSRATALLGQATRCFPCPSWSDRDRPAVLSPADVRASVLGNTPCVPGTGTVVRMYRSRRETSPPARDGAPGTFLAAAPGKQIELRVPTGSRACLDEALGGLPPCTPLALMTTPDPYANARLVWKPGQKAPEVLLAHDSDALHVTGGFVALAHAPGARDVGTVLEDGFSLELSESSWARLLQAVRDGVPLDLPGTDGEMGLSLDWVAAPRSAPPAPAPRWPGGKLPAVAVQGLFYQPDPVLRLRVDAEEFIEFLVAVDEAVRGHFASAPTGPGQDLTLVVAVRPGRQARYWLDFAPGEGRQEVIEGLRRRLHALRPPSVRRGPVCHTTQWQLWGGARQGGGFRVIPGEWEAALAAAGGELRIPDDVLRLTWPA